MADPIVTGLSTYGGKMRNEIIGQVFRKLANQGITILTDVKGETKFPKLKVSKGLKRYTGVFSAADSLTLSDRALSPKLAQFDLLIEPLKLHNTWFTEQQSKNALDAKLPFEAFAMQKLVEKVSDEIVASIIGKGDTANASGDLAIRICDGFLKRVIQLIAGGLTPIATGAIDDTNAVEKIEAMYSEAMATQPAWRAQDIRAYASWETVENYVRNYRTVFENDPANYSDGGRKLYLKNSLGKCELFPAEWMGTSGRIIMAPPTNMLVGTDALSDMNKIKIVDRMYSAEVGMTFVIDTQIVDEEAVWVNDQS